MQTTKTLQTIGSALILTSILMGCSLFNHSVPPTPSPTPIIVDLGGSSMGPISQNFINSYFVPVDSGIILNSTLDSSSSENQSNSNSAGVIVHTEQNPMSIRFGFDGPKITRIHNPDAFFALAAERNDLSFNRPVGFCFNNVISKPVASISISTTPEWLAPGSNQDLSDLVTIEFMSGQEYIDNGYNWSGLEHLFITHTNIDGQTGFLVGRRKITLTEFNAGTAPSRQSIVGGFDITFLSPPHQPGDYTFTVTARLGEGDDIETFTTSIGPIRVELQ
jgi:hypothetical protein